MAKSRRIPARLGLALVAAMLAGAAAAEDKTPLQPRFVAVDPTSGLAIDGFDPVAYFVDRRARRGRARFELTWSGAIWRFVNEGNRAAFADAPHVYMPSYGGFDARAYADRLSVPGDPRVWAIRKQRLFLFASPTRRFAWFSAADRFIARADELWVNRLN